MQPLFIIDLFICIMSFFFTTGKLRLGERDCHRTRAWYMLGLDPLSSSFQPCVLNLSAILPLLQMLVLYSLLVAYVMVASCF